MSKKEKDNIIKDSITDIEMLKDIYVMFMAIAILTTFLCCKTYKDYYYPEWSNGHKIGITNAKIENKFKDEETNTVFTQVVYKDSSNKEIFKWFQIDIDENEDIKVYYVVDNPIEQSRLTNPQDKHELLLDALVITIAGIMEYLLIYLVVISVISIDRNKILERRKEEKMIKR